MDEVIISAHGVAQFGQKRRCSRAKRAAGKDYGLEKVESRSPRRDDEDF